jgi:lipid-A-disaccharide synthase-like uncharacterized protein
MTQEHTIWLAVGFIGQLLFTSRFLVQWIASERAHRSVVPLAFWWFSIAGGATLLAYALWRRDSFRRRRPGSLRSGVSSQAVQPA